MKKKTKLKHKKKKKKILFKILLGVLVFIAAKVALHKFSYLFPTVSEENLMAKVKLKYFSQFFPTTGRDELEVDNDQLYHDGIELDRAMYYTGAQDISAQHRSLFSPNYEETRIKLT